MSTQTELPREKCHETVQDLTFMHELVSELSSEHGMGIRSMSGMHYSSALFIARCIVLMLLFIRRAAHTVGSYVCRSTCIHAHIAVVTGLMEVM